MSKTVIIPPVANLVSEVAELLRDGGSDYSRNLIVFPGKRPGHFLRRLLGEKTGHAYIPPRIFSIDGFIDFVYVERLGLLHREIQAIDAVAILHEVYLHSAERFGGTSFDALDAFLPLGLKLFGELEELKMANLQGRKLDEALTAVTLGNLRPLSAVYDAFYQKVNALGCCTRALKYAVVADFLTEDHLAEYASITLAGFFALTPSEKTIFRTLGRLDMTVFLYQEGKGLHKHLQDLGLKPSRATTSRTADKSRGDVFLYQAPDSHGQVLGLTGKIEERRANGSPLDARTVIVVTDPETLLPVYHQTLALLEEDEYNISLGYPVTRTPVYGFLWSLMNLVSSVQDGKFYAPDYMKFVLHPYTKNILFKERSDVTRILFHSIEEHLAGQKSLTWFSLDELESHVKLIDGAADRIAAAGVECSPQLIRQHLVTIHDNTIRRLSGPDRIGQLARRCIDVLVYIDEYSTARAHPFFKPYVETLIESLDDVAGSLLANAVLDDHSRAMSFLGQCMASAQVPFSGTPLRGLQVLGFLETRNIRFDTVYILDANEDTLPGKGGEHPIIPRSIREKLGLPTSRQREEIATYYFDVLVRGAHSVHLFFSENARKEKSRFVEQLLWERQKDEDKDDAREYISTIGYRISLANTLPGSVGKKDDVIEYLRRFTYHATALDTYLHCPLKFYHRYVLGLREKEEVAGDIDSGDVGSFVHEVMRLLFKDHIGKKLSPDDSMLAGLDAILDERFARWFGEEITGAKHVLRQQVRYQLRRLITHYQRPLCRREPITLLELESKVSRLTTNGFTFSGKLDRVEQRGQQTYILDYKTGGDEKRLGIDFQKLVVDQRETWAKAIGSLQLPMYMMLYAGDRKTTVENITAAYLLLGRNRIDESIEIRLFDDGVAVGEIYPKLEQIIFGLLKEITDREVPFVPTDDVQEHCPYCPYTTICGTGWVKKPGL